MTDDMQKLIDDLRKALSTPPKWEAIDIDYSKWEVLANGDIAPKKAQGCPKCGHRGDFIRMALVCPTHGTFGGC